MRLRNKITRREYAAGVLFSLGLILAIVALLKYADYAVFVLLTVVGACQLLVLRAIERGQAIERRKLDKLQKYLEKVGHAEQCRAVGPRVEESLSRIEGRLKAVPGEDRKEPIDFPLVAADEFIREIDQFDESEGGLRLSRLVSLKRVLRVVRPDTIVCGEGIANSLQRRLAVEDVEFWSFEDIAKDPGTGRRMLFIVDATTVDCLPRLVLEPNTYTSGILLIDLEDWAMPTNRFVEVLPAELLVGVRFYYPRDRVVDPDLWDMTTGSPEREMVKYAKF